MAELTVAEVAYAAGILDGEGCICITKQRSDRHHKRGYEMKLLVSIGNTDFSLLEWLRARFGGSIYSYSKSGNGRKPIGQWHLDSRKAIPFLKAVLPYLVIKQAQAELALDFQVGRVHTNRLTDEEDKLQVAQYLQMKKLK